MITTVVNFICAFIFIGALSNICIWLSYPLWKKWVKTANQLFSLCISPLALAVLGSYIALIKVDGWFLLKHCHGESCQAHSPHIDINNPVNQFIILVLGVFTVGTALLIFFRNRYTAEKLNALQQFSQTMPEHYEQIESDKILAFSSGLFKQTIFVSTGLITLLNKEELNGVLMHEQAHNIHKDNLRKNCIYWLSKSWLSNKEDVRQDFSLLCEFASDHYAAFDEQSKQHLLSAIKKIHQHKPSPIYLKRIEQLTAPPKSKHTFGFIVGYLSLLLGLLLLLSISYHHLAEKLFN